MSLYYDALTILENKSGQGGTLKSRIYNDQNKAELKSPPAQIYALITETRKWSAVLAEVLDRSGILRLERKLTPQLALFLAHDLLLSKNAGGGVGNAGGIAASARHPLRLAIEKHKARLRAEFTKLRIKRGYASVEALRAAVDAGVEGQSSVSNELKRDSDGDSREPHNVINAITVRPPRRQAHPRWVRINTLKSALQEQLSTTFSTYSRVENLKEVISASAAAQLLFIDPLVPNLLALPPNFELSSKGAYKQGKLIVQDKASCFPALLLFPKNLDPNDDAIDACAAPGNKTTHLAALMHDAQSQCSYHQKHSNDTVQTTTSTSKSAGKIFAFERDLKRTGTLRKMLSWAGTAKRVSVKGRVDFLKVDPRSEEYARVKYILLDPSCSGSGIVGRDDDEELEMVLPGSAALQSSQPYHNHQHARKKRKVNRLKLKDEGVASLSATHTPNDDEEDALSSPATLKTEARQRLQSLSTFQFSLLRHAMRFPSANRIVYSTCSTHWEENEGVVWRILQSDECQRGRWKILKRGVGQGVLASWERRGMKMRDINGKDEARGGAEEEEESGAMVECEKISNGSDEDADSDYSFTDACIRCAKYDGEGVMGFFVVAFVRSDDRAEDEAENEYRDRSDNARRNTSDEGESMDGGEEEEWKGLSDA